MQMLFFILTVIAVLAFNALVSYVLAWCVTEHWRPLINVKPFNCRGCLSFWLTFLMSFFWAYDLVTQCLYIEDAETRVIIYTGAVLASGLLGLINYLIVKSKFKVNE